MLLPSWRCSVFTSILNTVTTNTATEQSPSNVDDLQVLRAIRGCSVCHVFLSRLPRVTSSPSSRRHVFLRKNVILRACDFFDLFVFSAYQPDVFQALQQNRHPERSASRVYRVTQRLMRGVEGPRRCLSYPRRSELFNHGSAHRADPPRSFPWAENQEFASILLCPAATFTFSAATQARFTLA